MESKIEINAIVWSTNIETANKYAAEFTQGNLNGGYYTSSNEYILNTYVRCPNEPVTATPSSITDIVFVVVEDEEACEQAQKYLDSRRGIPFKICLTTQIGQFEQLESKQVNPSELANERGNILKEALAFEKTLVNVFKKFDINGNGLISTDELMQISKELGHQLTLDDAKMITDTLDSENKGNINFNGFKSWWVTGKSDFSNFRRVVKAELSVNKLVKMTSTKFNNYLSNLNENSNNVAAEEVQQTFNINLHSEKEFENGIGVFVDICSGEDAKEAIESQPENIRNSPISFSLSLEVESNEVAVQIAEMLNQMIEPMLSEIPQASIFLQMGVKLNIRAHQNKIFGEITCQDNAAEIIASQSNMFQTGEIKAQGAGTLHAFTSANIKDIYTKDLNAYELIEKAINFKLHFNSKSYNLRGYIDSICGMLEQQITSGLQMSSKLRNMILLARVGGILRDFSWDLKFSPTDILDCLILSCDKENVGDDGFENLSFAEYKVKNANDGKFSKKLNDRLRNKIEELVAQGQAMREMIPPEFLEIFKSINTEKIEIQLGFNTTAARSMMKISLNLPGLNSVKDLLLN